MVDSANRRVDSPISWDRLGYPRHGRVGDSADDAAVREVPGTSIPARRAPHGRRARRVDSGTCESPALPTRQHTSSRPSHRRRCASCTDLAGESSRCEHATAGHPSPSHQLSWRGMAPPRETRKSNHFSPSSKRDSMRRIRQFAYENQLEQAGTPRACSIHWDHAIKQQGAKGGRVPASLDAFFGTVPELSTGRPRSHALERLPGPHFNAFRTSHTLLGSGRQPVTRDVSHSNSGHPIHHFDAVDTPTALRRRPATTHGIRHRRQHGLDATT
jgi:hypothetical protein